MSRGTRTLACRAAGLSGVGRSVLPLHGASVAVAADENAYRLPWQSLNALEDNDLKALYAYLRSLPPIKNRVPAAVVAEPGSGNGK
jgi:hypothetical protein